MPRGNILLFTCILFCYLFHAGHGVEAGIYKRSISQEDAEFIKSLAEQLYNAEARSTGTSSDDEDKKEEGDIEDRGAQGDELGTELIRAVDLPANTEETAKEEGIAPAGSDTVKKSPTSTPKAHEGVPLVAAGSGDAKDGDSTMYLIILITVCCLAGVVALIFATVCFYSHQNQKEKTKQIPYASTPIYTYETVPATKYGTEYSAALLPTDNALAISAQKFHFQHSKQKILDMENENKEMEPASHLSVDCTDEVYETPGFAPMWDVEVNCPLYNEDATPGTTPRDNTPMMRNHSPDANRRSSGDEGGEGGENNIRHPDGDASNVAQLTNGPKSILHGEVENETFLMDSSGMASQSGAANDNNSNETNVNSNVTDVNSNNINGISGANGFHE